MAGGRSGLRGHVDEHQAAADSPCRRAALSGCSPRTASGRTGQGAGKRQAGLPHVAGKGWRASAMKARVGQAGIGFADAEICLGMQYSPV